MFWARGKVVVRESGAGVPDLVVVLYDLDPRTVLDEVGQLSRTVHAVDLWNGIQGDRLGSVVTDLNGQFELSLDGKDSQIRNSEKRPDLLLLVTAPEQADEDHCPAVLHVSCVRENARRQESFVIWVPAAVLEDAGIPVPIARRRPTAVPRDILWRIHDEQDRELEVRHGLREMVQHRLARTRQQRDLAARALPSPVPLLSSISQSVRQSVNYVDPGSSIEQATGRVITRAAEGRFNASGFTRTAVLSLTSDQRSRLTDASGQLRQDLTSQDLAGLMLTQRNPAADSPTDLVRLTPFHLCRPRRQPDEDCNHSPAVPAGAGTAQPITAPAAPDGSSLTVNDLPQFLSRLLSTVSAPEGLARLEAAGRALPQDVQSVVDSFQLRGGPADQPAFYEFHNLHIAFEHVWREAFDEDLFYLIRQTYQVIEELGGNPDGAVANNSIQALCTEGEDTETAMRVDPPVEVIQTFKLTAEQWAALSLQLQSALAGLAQQYLAALDSLQSAVAQLGTAPTPANAFAAVKAAMARQALTHVRRSSASIVHYADSQRTAKTPAYDRLHTLVQELSQRLKEGRHAFTIYAADPQQRSVNYGLLVTYRQRWEPLTYQVGELLKTIPLAPKETRKFRKKVTTKRRRAEREVENNLKSRRDERSETWRFESDVIQKANARTNFQLSAEADFDLVVASGKSRAAFEKDDAAVSEEVKKEFREAVIKAAEDLKRERTVEINTEDTGEDEGEESGEILNPNDELPVTFLFYELQRRYRISEQIHRLRPVILVAQEVPAPHEITEAWLVAHDWILRRVILDDSFTPALNYLSTRLPGDEFALEQLRRTMELQRQVVEHLKEEVTAIREQAGQRYAALERSIQRRADVIEEEEGEGFVESVTEFWSGSSGESEEAARIREEASRDAHERAAKEEKELRARLEREITALNAATEAYTQALRQHLNTKAQIVRLQVHIKDNILYYMHAIWNHEPPDQRFFRLHAVPVPELSGTVTYAARQSSATNTQPQLGTTPIELDAQVVLDLPLQWTTLTEVADLDTLLGFKGNYMIFPLKTGNALTEFMMAPYVDSALDLHDPDELGNWTLEEFAEYVCCLRHHFGDGFDSFRDSLRQQYRRLLSQPRRTSDEITVPTGSLYIEALPGAYPILEDFKLLHRAADVLKVRAEIRKAELENLRKAARLLSDEYDDPDVDRRIIVEGHPNTIVAPDGN
jgi:hypothetical protein